MKARNFFLSLVAVIVAVGSAMASFAVADPTNDWVTLSGTCTSISEQSCNQQSTQACQVRIILNGVDQGLFAVNDERIIAACATPKRDNRSQPIATVQL